MEKEAIRKEIRKLKRQNRKTGRNINRERLKELRQILLRMETKELENESIVHTKP